VKYTAVSHQTKKNERKNARKKKHLEFFQFERGETTKARKIHSLRTQKKKRGKG